MSSATGCSEHNTATSPSKNRGRALSVCFPTVGRRHQTLRPCTLALPPDLGCAMRPAVKWLLPLDSRLSRAPTKMTNELTGGLSNPQLLAAFTDLNAPRDLQQRRQSRLTRSIPFLATPRSQARLPHLSYAGLEHSRDAEIPRFEDWNTLKSHPFC